MRLRVLETLPLRTATDPSRPWDVSKTVLTRCRLLLDLAASSPPPFSPSPASPTSSNAPTASSSSQDTQDASLTGLVLLSLHANPPSSSLSHVRSIPPPFLPTRKRDPGGATATQDAATLFFPANAHDLSFVCPGIEVWAWDPMNEVELPEDGAVAREWVAVAERKGIAKFEPDTAIGEEGDVFWDARPQEERERYKEEERRRDDQAENGERALVCARFGLVG